MIPNWNGSGVIPPIRPGDPGGSINRSPYKVELYQVVEKYATSTERIKILKDLLVFREKLHEIGITNGFQWLDGSFMENIEIINGRPPKDVDVVTFFHLPTGVDQQHLVSKHSELFIPREIKKHFNIDGYPCILGTPTEGHHVKQISYWYSMWSHRRDFLWKGFIQVDLSPTEDIAATKSLELIQQEGE